MNTTLLKKLELCETPSQEELDRHFYRLIKRYHPDRNPEKQDWANQKMREIIFAYKTLKKSFQENGIGTCSYLATEQTYRPNPFQKVQSPYRAKTRHSQERFVSFQVLKTENRNCLIPLVAVHRINQIEELNVKKASVLFPKELLYLANTGQAQKKDTSEIFSAKPQQILFWLLPERKKRALLLAPAWELANRMKIDICSTPILPSAEAEGIRIYHKNEIFYCPAELVFQMNVVNFPAIQKQPQR